MIKKFNQLVRWFPVELVALYLGLSFWMPTTEIDPELWRTQLFFLLAVMVAAFIGIVRAFLITRHEECSLDLTVDTQSALDRINEFAQSEPQPAANQGPVDLWTSQFQLMQASGQRTPGAPGLTPDSFLYLALIAEELGELALEMAHSLYDPDGHVLVTSGMTMGQIHDLNVFATKVSALHESLTKSSKELRSMVGDGVLSPVEKDLTHQTEYLGKVLDGITDLAVVTAGFSIASGLPARGAYRDVAGSNLSKANPETGLIDKDASGKWIKGTHYQPPQLDQVLEEARQNGTIW